jgi:hypothetical protein
MNISPSATRVSGQTSAASNERIRRQTEANIAFYAQHPALIDRRLAELDQEWDIERVLETGSSTLTLTGLLLGITSSRKWLLLSLAVQGFFMQHAVQGWCPPLPMFRRLGVRTADEINQERYALKALRGDFRDLRDSDATQNADRVLQAVRS